MELEWSRNNLDEISLFLFHRGIYLLFSILMYSNTLVASYDSIIKNRQGGSEWEWIWLELVLAEIVANLWKWEIQSLAKDSLFKYFSFFILQLFISFNKLFIFYFGVFFFILYLFSILFWLIFNNVRFG